MANNVSLFDFFNFFNFFNFLIFFFKLQTFFVFICQVSVVTCNVSHGKIMSRVSNVIALISI